MFPKHLSVRLTSVYLVTLDHNRREKQRALAVDILDLAWNRLSRLVQIQRQAVDRCDLRRILLKPAYLRQRHMKTHQT